MIHSENSPFHLIDKMNTEGGKTWIKSVLMCSDSVDILGYYGFFKTNETINICSTWNPVAFAVDNAQLKIEQAKVLSLDNARKLYLLELGFGEKFNLNDQDVYKRLCFLGSNSNWNINFINTVYNLKHNDSF